jgi:hypothetical protein
MPSLRLADIELPSMERAGRQADQAIDRLLGRSRPSAWPWLAAAIGVAAIVGTVAAVLTWGRRPSWSPRGGSGLPGATDQTDAGIDVVHQERNLFPTFTIAENIMVEHYTDRMMRRVKEREINKSAEKYIDMVGLKIAPAKSVETLSAGQQQLIEIAKALSSEAKIILLDEPTSSISVNEAEMLLGKKLTNLANLYKQDL